MRSVVVWPDAFAVGYTRLEEGKAFEMEFGQTKSGDITLKDVPKKETV